MAFDNEEQPTMRKMSFESSAVMTGADDGAMLTPRKLRVGDKVRFVSPASTPDKESVLRRAAILKSWGLEVDFGDHAFRKEGYLAGTDDERLTDLNAALRDASVRAVFATRGGKGSYRIADRLDIEAARADPKFLVGFSDITILHLALWKGCRLVGIHGSVLEDSPDGVHQQNNDALRAALTDSGRIEIRSRAEEPTAALTTAGEAKGPLIGGNLEMVSTAAGWALPDLRGALLLLEAVGMQLGQIDRQLTMLRKAGHLDGIAGVAFGQFTDCASNAPVELVELLHHHLNHLDVPVLGGLPLGHGLRPMITPVGALASLDAGSGRLVVPY